MPSYVVVYMEEEKEYCYHFSKILKNKKED